MHHLSQNPFERSRITRPRSDLQILNTSSSYNSLRYDPLLSDSKSKCYTLNIWKFRDDHNRNSRVHSFNYALKPFSISQFERSIILSTKSEVKKQFEQSNSQGKYSMMYDNPFYRKNLLVSKEKIQEAIEKDLNIVNYKCWNGSSNGKYQYESPNNYAALSEQAKQSNYQMITSMNMQKYQQTTTNDNTQQNQQNGMQYFESFKYQPTKKQEDSLFQKQPFREYRDDWRAKSQKQHSQYSSRSKEGAKEFHLNHANYKPSITVKGQKFYRTKVFMIDS